MKGSFAISAHGRLETSHLSVILVRFINSQVNVMLNLADMSNCCRQSCQISALLCYITCCRLIIFLRIMST
jgi:hypothetical protein